MGSTNPEFSGPVQSLSSIPCSSHIPLILYKIKESVSVNKLYFYLMHFDTELYFKEVEMWVWIGLRIDWSACRAGDMGFGGRVERGLVIVLLDFGGWFLVVWPGVFIFAY